MYAKEDRKQMSQQQISKANEEAFLVLSQYNCDEQSAEGFIKKLAESVNELLAKPDETTKSLNGADLQPDLPKGNRKRKSDNDAAASAVNTSVSANSVKMEAEQAAKRRPQSCYRPSQFKSDENTGLQDSSSDALTRPSENSLSTFDKPRSKFTKQVIDTEST